MKTRNAYTLFAVLMAVIGLFNMGCEGYYYDDETGDFVPVESTGSSRSALSISPAFGDELPEGSLEVTGIARNLALDPGVTASQSSNYGQWVKTRTMHETYLDCRHLSCNRQPHPHAAMETCADMADCNGFNISPHNGETCYKSCPVVEGEIRPIYHPEGSGYEAFVWNDVLNPAHYAIDGNHNTFNHTDGPNSWLRINLGKRCEISQIKLRNRPHNNRWWLKDRLANFNVLLHGPMGIAHSWANNPADPSRSVFEFNAPSPVTAETVTITQPGRYLHLLEVEVMGTCGSDAEDTSTHEGRHLTSTPEQKMCDVATGDIVSRYNPRRKIYSKSLLDKAACQNLKDTWNIQQVCTELTLAADTKHWNGIMRAAEENSLKKIFHRWDTLKTFFQTAPVWAGFLLGPEFGFPALLLSGASTVADEVFSGIATR